MCLLLVVRLEGVGMRAMLLESPAESRCVDGAPTLRLPSYAGELRLALVRARL